MKTTSQLISALASFMILGACATGHDDLSSAEEAAKRGQEVCGAFGDGTGASGGTGKIDVDGDLASVFVSAPSGYLIDAYCVKAGTDVVLVIVDPAKASLQLTAPNGKDVSHFSLRFIPEVSEGEWCSPGFWRNQPGQWPDGFHGTFYNDYAYAFAPATLPGNPTLDEVLASPQTYGGAAFNNVADVLSEASGFSVVYTEDGGRVHNCPLSADQASK
jgi:hypothetical protein